MQKALKYLSRVALCCLAVTLALAFISGGRLQSLLARPGQRLVLIDLPLYRDAIRITRITVGPQGIAPGIYRNPRLPGEPFRGDERWLRDLNFGLMNRTSKTIAAFAFDVCFPETEESGPMVCYPVEQGRIPENPAHARGGAKPHQDSASALHFGPGLELTISLHQSADSIREFVEQRKRFAEINTCFIHFEDVYFDDGMKWTSGYYSVPDERHPGTEKILTASYFPGELDK